MRALVVPPAITLVLAAAAVGAANLLDTGGTGQRDAALLVGTAGFWVLAFGTVWLIAALAYHFYRRRRIW